MKQDDILNFGDKSDLKVKLTLNGYVIQRAGMERFADFVRADEREACAKILDEMADDMEREMEPSTAIAYVRSKAAAIRARGRA